MNASLMILEIAVLVLALGVLLLDLWTPAPAKRWLGYGAALGLVLVLAYSFRLNGATAQYAFGWNPTSGTPDLSSGPYVLDGLALFFKWFFLLAAILVLILAVDFADRIETGISEYYGLVLFALCG